MTEQRCSPTGRESVNPTREDYDPQAIADEYGDYAVPCGKIGETYIHLRYPFIDVLEIAARYLAERRLETDWGDSGLTVREYLKREFGVVSARVDARQEERDARWFRKLLVQETRGFWILNYALRLHLVRAEPPGTIWEPPKTWGKKVDWQRFQLRQPTPRRSPKWLSNENSIAPEGPSNKAPARGPRSPIKSGLLRPITSAARI